jgi:hypothetical protein
MPGQEVGHHLGIAAVGQVHGVEPGAHAEILHGQMTGNSDAAATVDDRLFRRGRGLGEGNELLHRIDRDGRMHDQHLPAARQHRDRLQILVRVERHLAIDTGIDRERRAEHHPERVSVGSRLGDRLGTNVAGRSRTVLNHDRLPEASRQPVSEDPRHRVARRAGNQGDDELDRVARIAFGCGAIERPRAAYQCRGSDEKPRRRARGPNHRHAHLLDHCRPALSCLTESGSTLQMKLKSST